MPLNATNGSLLGVHVRRRARIAPPARRGRARRARRGRRARRARDRGRPGRRDGVAPRGVSAAPAPRLVAPARVDRRERRSSRPSSTTSAARSASSASRSSSRSRTARRFRPRSSTGWGSAGPPPTGLTPATLGPLLDAEYEIEGCYLLPFEVARPRVTHIRYASALNGNGPHAWNRHWLVVPLTDREGTLQGFIWAGRPGRPARAAAREDAGAASVRQPGVGGARVGGALRGAAVPRRPRPAHAAAEPARVRAAARRSRRRARCATAIRSRSCSATSTSSRS